ncbi:hypothetical protein IB61_10275 [Brucella abortus LMN2]|nr:hypothetical protein IB61_10275 [Brucella abortus LMN2]
MKIRQVVARSVDFQAAHNGVRRIDRDRIAGAKAVEDGARLSGQFDGAVNDDRAFMPSGTEPDHIARLGFFNSRLYTFSDSNIDLPCLRACAKCGGKQAHDASGTEQAGENHVRQAFFGSTSIRPCISICMAWQNHEQ